VTALTLLHHAIRWLEEASQLSEAHAAWLFALLARVDTPLDADAGAALRHMCRTLCALRASLNGEHSRATQLPQLNLLISLADAFFHCGLTEPH
jgi:survival of motor neuron protein-interacting protein 1